jgi:uncharacterized membrane protein
MGKGRVEAFSDGVIAVIITIMVLELKAPHSAQLTELKPLLPVFLSYVLSFVYVGIYWNNHHHMLQATKTVNGPILWANLHLLFWLSVIPFASSWMGENHLATAPVALYGAVLLMTAVAYTVLAALLVGHEGPQSDLARALGSDVKGKASLLFYVGGIIAAFFVPVVSIVLYVAVALIWLIPDRRIERQLKMN